MPESLQPPGPPNAIAEDDHDRLRLLSRSPHPYHRQQFELLQPSDQLLYRAKSSTGHSKPNVAREPLLSSPSFTKESSPATDSGTDADDEHFLKGLPAPKARLRKGIRGKNEPLSGSSTPLLTPLVLEDELREITQKLKRESSEDLRRKHAERVRFRKEVFRRVTEVIILGVLGWLVKSNTGVRPVVGPWKAEMLALLALAVVILGVYPLRLILWAYKKGVASRWLPIAIPVSFDPAPILYPPTITVYVSLLISVNMPQVVLPNLILSVCTIPMGLIPTARPYETYSPMHWLLSCLPLATHNVVPRSSAGLSGETALPDEVLVLLYPLHQSLCLVLHYLTTTSLLPAELQLLSVSLINILLLAASPQVEILKALLWGGGMGLIILCGQVIRWGITLARVPKWRFRRAPVLSKQSMLGSFISLFTFKKLKLELLGSTAEDTSCETGYTTDEADASPPFVSSLDSMLPHMDLTLDGEPISQNESVPVSPERSDVRFAFPESANWKKHLRRHTLPVLGTITKSKTHTPSGRRKRSASSSVRAFFSLTQAQATVRRWLYAGWVYVCTLGIILVVVREYVARVALRGNDPIGWALGYMFGDLPSFRFEVVKANLERWVCLPPRLDSEGENSCHLGWVEHMRHAAIGEANTRLIVSAYWGLIVIMGLAVVFQLSPIYEVDTRRKVFHFMMVAMFLPATFVDPTFAALALSIVLAVFLLLDLLRASQLPPLSKPIAAFLTPYVDGRDLRGPVVISHIFLLIGCAIPLWLSLASLPRSGFGYLEGWEIPTREVSMVAGVVCVGLGDAAASLIGRRYGHHKWLWGGGKSLEGSVAFATAVFFGLMAANIWLRVGGWPVTSEAGLSVDQQGGFTGIVNSLGRWDWLRSVRDTTVCASMASLTEAVLTGGNDNVVVPVILWTCVKSLGI